MIFAKKKKTLSEKVIECGEDSKRLYALRKNKLVQMKRQNPIPSRTSEQEQADLSVNYFHQKIVNIREALSEYDEYSPSGKCNDHQKSISICTSSQSRRMT